MRCPRLRFSLRTLLIAVAVLAALLGLSIRFGPHVVWKIAHHDIASGVVPIPSKPLIDALPHEDLITCSVGPLSLEFPNALAKNLIVHGGIGGVFLQFHDDHRSLVLQLPKRAFKKQIEGFPEKSTLSFPRLYKETADAQSSDFSFGMSHRELQWHIWLLRSRSMIGDIDHVEFLWRPDLDGKLVSQRSVRTYQWATTDGKWEGTMYFKGFSSGEVEWIRHACSTFAIDGDPSVFEDRDDQAVESMVTLTQTGLKP